jgi:glutaredoxin 3
MREIIIYSKALCPYCVKAKELLEQKKIDFVEIDILSDDKKKDEMIEKSGRMSVPQIFIGEKHIGGFDDLKELEKKEELEILLEEKD